jgi:MFS family permease
VAKDQHPPKTTPSFLWPFKGVYYGWAILGAAFVISFTEAPVFGPVVSIFVGPIEEDLGWTRTTISLAFTIGSIAGSLASLIVGILLDRFGSRWVISITALVMAGAMVGLSTMTEPWQYWAYFGIARGAAMAGVQLAIIVTTANWFIRMRGRATAVGGSGLRAGQFAMPLILLAVITTYSWREAYLLSAVLMVVFIMGPAALYLRRRPEDLGLLPDGDSPAIVKQDSSESPATPAPMTDISWTLREAVRTPALWLLMLAITAGHFSQTAVNLHMAVSLQDKGMAFAPAVFIVAIFGLTSAIAVFPAGFLMERLQVRHGIIMVSLLFAASMLILIRADTFLIAVGFSVLFGITSALWTITQRLVFPDYFGRRYVGSIRGFAEPFMGLLAPIGPLLAGILRDSTGDYDLIFTIFIGMFFLMFAAIVMARPPKRKPAILAT